MTIFRRIGANDGVLHQAQLLFTEFPMMGRLRKENIAVSPGNKGGRYEERLTPQQFLEKYEPVYQV